MVSREQKRKAAVVLHEKLQLLRSITNSHAEDDTSIILDASKYIEELKQKVDRLNQDIIDSAQSSNTQDSLPTMILQYVGNNCYMHKFIRYKVLPPFFIVRSISPKKLIYDPFRWKTLMKVKVETLEKGFLINVLSEKNCPGLLVSVLEAFEALNLVVVEARASCTDNFQLEAVSVEDEDDRQIVDAHVVRRAVMQAIRHWNLSNNDHQ